MANTIHGHPARVDFLIDGVAQETLEWSDSTSSWLGAVYQIVPNSAPEGWVVSYRPGLPTTLNPPKVADSTSANAFPSSPVTGTTSIRSDGKVGYKPVGSGSTSNWYEIVVEGDASVGDSSGNPLSGGGGGGGGGGAAGDPHITPIFGEKYDL